MTYAELLKPACCNPVPCHVDDVESHIADANSDGTLDFDEFCELVKLQARLQRRAYLLTDRPAPKKVAPMPSREMLRDWFHMIDTDHSGSLSLTEYFAFSLREALSRSAAGASDIRLDMPPPEHSTSLESSINANWITQSTKCVAVYFSPFGIRTRIR